MCSFGDPDVDRYLKRLDQLQKHFEIQQEIKHLLDIAINGGITITPAIRKSMKLAVLQCYLKD